MEFELRHAREILERTPVTLSTMLSGIADEWLLANEGPDTWSPLDVVSHLIHGEEVDWIPRARIIIRHGESFTFEPFDPSAFADRESIKGKGLRELLDTFATLRARNLTSLDEMDLTVEKLELAGTHPEFGRVTMAQLIATWAAHDLSHIVQAARAMAKRYDIAVGPWKEYLSVLK